MGQIVFDDLWEMYRIRFVIGGKSKWESFWALKGINFTIEQGEAIGIIGENGAGKSTILKIICGMLAPDRGKVKVSGKISGLLELGAGFQVELTGSENIYLIAGLFGLTGPQVESIYNNIVSFAAIGKFINAPVKCYSQGMYVRLAFAIAINMNPDVLLIDDTLAVGDEYFQKKCIKKIFELKEQGKTIVFVTHDMNMLRRICQRAIFLKDGQIVKDGLVDQVIPLYAQTAGAKEGVAILENQPLRLIFNNGRLFVNWHDKLLLPDSGLYTSFLASEKWYSSFQADWKVKREGQNKLEATGVFYQLNCIQTWKIVISDSSEIAIDIEMDSQELLHIQEGCTNIVLSDKYEEWFSDQENGRFPAIDDKNNKWEALANSQEPKICIGVKSADSNNQKLPSFILEQKDCSLINNLQIFNSGYLNHSRVLQHSQKSLQNYAKDYGSKLRYFTGKIRIDTSNIEEYLDKLQQDSTIADGKMKLRFSQGKCIIYYDNMPLTKANHATVCMDVGGRVYSSDTAHWDLIEKNEKKIITRGSWGQLPVTQTWKIEIVGENLFTWEVEIDVASEAEIEKQYMSFECSERYNYYFSDYGTGKFIEKFLESEVDILQRCIPAGTVGLFNSDNFPLPISVKSNNESSSFFKIFNTDIFSKARVLRINRVEAEEKIRFSCGKHVCFKTEVSLNKNENAVIKDCQLLLSEGKLKLLLDKNKACIFWREAQLTKGLGLYTSLRSAGRWYDSSSSAIWNYSREDKNIISTAKWLYLPLRQLWQFSLKGENTIQLIVKMIVDKKIDVDRLQTNIMLSGTYKRWMTNNEGGLFPDFEGNIDDDWQVLWSDADIIKADENYIGVADGRDSNNYLPIVKLIPGSIDPEWQLNILNSDLYHRGRVLQYLKKENTVLSPGEYPYFKGEILIEGN